MLDAIIVGVVVAAAVFFLGWTFRPRRKAGGSLPCGNCSHPVESKPSPVKLK